MYLGTYFFHSYENSAKLPQVGEAARLGYPAERHVPFSKQFLGPLYANLGEVFGGTSV